MELYAGLSSAESRSRERSASTGVAKAATANTTASPRNRFVICPLRYARCRTTYEFIPVANQARQVRRRGGHTPKERARLTGGGLVAIRARRWVDWPAASLEPRRSTPENTRVSGNGPA